MKVPLAVVSQATTLLERQQADLKDVISKVDGHPGMKAEVTKLLGIWHNLEQVREVLQALHRGALADDAR